MKRTRGYIFKTEEEKSLEQKERDAKKQKYRQTFKDRNPDYGKMYYQKNRDKLLEQARKRNAARREETQLHGHARRFQAIQTLGGRCEHCGESDTLVLQIDHKVEFHLKGQKRQKKDRGDALHRRILDGCRKTIQELQILCANCHLRKTILSDPKNQLIVDNFERFKAGIGPNTPNPVGSRYWSKYNPKPPWE